jgi:hypothetical protein
VKSKTLALFLSLLVVVLLGMGSVFGAFQSVAIALPLYLTVFACATLIIRLLMTPPKPPNGQK